MYTAASMVADIAENTGIAKGVVRNVLATQEALIVECIKECEKVKVGSVVQIEVKIRPARKKRKGRNPATGEEIQIAAKPASPVVKARLLKAAKDATPSLAVARKRI